MLTHAEREPWLQKPLEDQAILPPEWPYWLWVTVSLTHQISYAATCVQRMESSVKLVSSTKNARWLVSSTKNARWVCV
jgi:hypothetical protein